MNAIFNLVAYLSLLSTSQQQPNPLPAPLPVPNTYFPSELAGGLFGTTSAAGTSEHLRVSMNWSRGGSRVTMKWSERSGSSGPWYETVVEDSTSQTITAAADREGGREVYVAAVRRDGVRIIQRWAYAARQNGYALSAGGVQPSGIGTPMPTFQPVELINGEGFVPPQSPTGQPPTRELIWSSPTGDIISGLAVDPEGRYLLMLSYPDGILRRLDLVPEVGTPLPILSPQEQPFLAGATSLALWHHVTEGRKLVITKLEGSTVHPDRLLIGDVNNDGVYEGAAVYSPAQWSAAGYGDHQVWGYYWNTGVTFDWD